MNQEINRGFEAERLMSDPLMVEAFQEIERGLVEALKRADLKDREMQHEIVLSLQVMSRVQGFLKDVIATGKMARLQKETAAQRLKNAVGWR